MLLFQFFLHFSVHKPDVTETPKIARMNIQQQGLDGTERYLIVKMSVFFFICHMANDGCKHEYKKDTKQNHKGQRQTLFQLRVSVIDFFIVVDFL